MMPRLFCVFALLLCALGRPIPADAQGNGHAYGHSKNGGSPGSMPSAAGSPEIQISGTGTRNFGSWLDAASVLPQGDAFVSFGVGMWHMPGYREIDFPMIDTGMGLHRRIQVGGSVPYFYANEPAGPVARGFGNTYLTAKVQLREPRQGRLGFAVTPILELLAAAPVEGGSREGWAVPLNLELQQSGWRAFGSVGYFSRGAIFASAAVERQLTGRTWVTGSITQSHSMKGDPLSFAMGLSKTRVDATATVSGALTRHASIFGSIGRTISRTDANSATLALSGGVAFQMQQ
jgi:hypothetical protein